MKRNIGRFIAGLGLFLRDLGYALQPEPKQPHPHEVRASEAALRRMEGDYGPGHRPR